ncbi:MAG: hypothetical protein WBG70_16685 [Spirulinaceae cyanobacterium]
MAAKKSKNDQAWEILFEEENILKKIEQEDFFYISSTRINEQREARLMTKFDHVVQLPKIFLDHGLSIQPVSRRKYVIGAFNSYFQLPKKDLGNVVYCELPNYIKTLDPSNIYSESSAILCAFLSGMIDDVLEEETSLTVFGRMSTGTFDYDIQDTKNKTKQTINVNKSQCEIDGGFEGATKLGIIEAKSETVNDFIIRQLYYPYRLWKSKTNKEVIPVFLTISNDIFSFYKFRFSDINLYNSIELVSEHKYCLSKYEIELQDIRDILNETTIVPDSEEIPFPQANMFPRIIDLLGRLYSANVPLNKDNITLIYAFDIRQTDYYISAANYLRLVDREQNKTQDVNYSLSNLGLQIITQHPRRRNLELVKCILSHRIFNSSLRIYFEKAQPPTKEEIVSIMRDGSEEISSSANSTCERRASTVRGWIEWILKLT